MKTIFEKLKSEIKSEMSEQDQGIIQKRIQELGELSHDFISEAYSVNQEQTVELLKEGRIGGFSIIGESLNFVNFCYLYLKIWQKNMDSKRFYLTKL